MPRTYLIDLRCADRVINRISKLNTLRLDIIIVKDQTFDFQK